MRIRDEFKAFLELLTEVKGVHLSDEIYYLNDLFLGIICRRFFGCKKIHPGYFIGKI